jgi:hypothetical protein
MTHRVAIRSSSPIGNLSASGTASASAKIGARTWVWLNDKLVVDGATDGKLLRSSTKPLPPKGPIMLQTHGGEIRWRNLQVREIGAEEAKKILAEAARRNEVMIP